MRGLKVQSGELPWLQLAGTRFHTSKCLFAGAGGLDISAYTAGILCGNLMARCGVVLDYARQRIAFLPAEPSSVPAPSTDDGDGSATDPASLFH